MLDKNKMRDAVLTYASYFKERNIDGLVSLFTPDAVFEDPVDQPARVGSAEIRQFFEEGFNQVNGEMIMLPEGEVRITDRHAACAMLVTCGRAEPAFRIATLDVFSFADDGRFTSMKAYWGSASFHPM